MTESPRPSTADRPRAADRRPRVVLFDVFETMLQVDALGARFVDVGRPAGEWELFFTRTLRDGMALTLAGAAPPFGDVARAALRTTTGHTLSDEALDHVLAGFAHLPPHPDVEPALQALARAKVPTYAFTHGNPGTACDALDRAGLRTYLRGVPNLLVVSDAPAPPVEAGRPPVLDVLHGAPSPKTNGAPPLALLPATRGWEADCKKNIPALVAAWSRFPSKAFYVLVDDDTWLSLPALGALLARQNASAPLYLGNPYVISGSGCDGLRIEARAHTLR